MSQYCRFSAQVSSGLMPLTLGVFLACKAAWPLGLPQDACHVQDLTS